MANVRGAYSQGDVYNRIKRPGVVQTPSYLRLEKSIQNTLTGLTFDVLSNQGSPNVTERRLQLTDTFTVLGMSVFIMKAGTTTSATQAQISTAQLRSWPNPTVFSGANEADNLQAFYNGFLQLRVNTTVYIDSLDLMSFYRVGQAQEGNGPALATQNDEWSLINWGFKKMVPTITLNGAAKNEISLTFPNPTNFGGTNSQNFAVCYLRGILSQNDAVLNPGL